MGVERELVGGRDWSVDVCGRAVCVIMGDGIMGRYARVLNRAGVCVAYYNENEWSDGELRGALNSTDRVEIYGEDGAWIETLAGAEFLRGYCDN